MYMSALEGITTIISEDVRKMIRSNEKMESSERVFRNSRYINANQSSGA